MQKKKKPSFTLAANFRIPTAKVAHFVAKKSRVGNPWSSILSIPRKLCLEILLGLPPLHQQPQPATMIILLPAAEVVVGHPSEPSPPYR